MTKDKLIAIGEALIDFAPKEIGVPLKDVSAFQKVVGGAPANVCGAFAKLGGKAALITQLGDDPFGECIIEELKGHGIETDYILRTNKANTALAFVSLKEDGNREFSFYRKPSADMLLEAEQIKNEWFKDAYALHFCSVDLIPSPMKEAHKKVIDYGLENDLMISFDPNLRLALWDDYDNCKNTILEFIPKAHIVKISDEELEFITGYKTMEEAKQVLFQGNVSMVVYTKGSGGAEIYTRTTMAQCPSRKVNAVDTTGAGDGFIGSFLYQLMEHNITKNNLDSLSHEEMIQILRISNEFCGYSVLGTGSIVSYPNPEQLKEYMNL